MSNDALPEPRSIPLDPSSFEVEATAVDDDTEDKKRMRELEKQMQEMMQRNETGNDGVGVGSAGNAPSTDVVVATAGEADGDNRSCWYERRFYIIGVIVLAIVVAVVGYFLTQGSESESVTAGPQPTSSPVQRYLPVLLLNNFSMIHQAKLIVSLSPMVSRWMAKKV
jgi:hypothetical protein